MSEVLAQLEKKGGGGGLNNYDVLKFDTDQSTGYESSYSYAVTAEQAEKYKAFLIVTRSSSADPNAIITVTTNTINANAIYQTNNTNYQKSVFFADNVVQGATFACKMRYNHKVFVVIGIY